MADRQRRILVTGATSGIGLALVQRLALRHHVMATGRKDVETARAVLPANVSYIAAPLTDPAAATRLIADGLLRAGWTKLDNLVLNAGTGHLVTAAGVEEEARIRETLDVNLLAPVLLARALFPWLEKTGGTLTLVGSVAHTGAANFPSYAASKAGLDGLARALRAEWQGRVTVQIVHPGPTATPMHAKAGFDPGRLGGMFTPAPVMAAMVERAMVTGRSPLTLSFGARLLHAIRPETRL